MTDTQAHPDGGSRDEGPLSSITDSDREAVRRTEEAPHKCHDILACHDLLVTEADRLRQQNTELREALERVAVVAEHYMPNDDYDGPGEVHAALHEAWDAIHEVRALLARTVEG